MRHTFSLHVNSNLQKKFLHVFACYFDADMEPLQTNLDLEEGYCKALLCRLRFRKVLSCVDSLMFCNLFRLLSLRHL